MKKYKDIVGDGGSNIIDQVVEQMARLKARMAGIKTKVAVMSGKGGVGKSAVTANFAAAFAMNGLQVGILDADLNGPTIAKMMGVRAQRLRVGQDGVHPALGPSGINVMSMDLFLPRDETPVIWDAPTQEDSFVWRATLEVSVLREFLTDAVWGELDLLLIDLPPGTDRISTIAGVLPEMDRSILITIPSEVSQLVVKKSIVVAKETLKAPPLGLVENMAAYLCPRCGAEGELFHPGDSERTAASLGIPFLGRIPFDPRISISSDQGVPFVMQHADSPAGRVFLQLAERTAASLGMRPSSPRRD